MKSETTEGRTSGLNIAIQREELNIRMQVKQMRMKQNRNKIRKIRSEKSKQDKRVKTLQNILGNDDNKSIIQETNRNE